jgi:hypothetical protein
MIANEVGGDYLPHCAFDARSPIIVIGAGRSGSTLLVRMLDNHPDISFKGETKFLLHQVWDILWKNPFWYWFGPTVESKPHSSQECSQQLDEQLLKEERRWAGNLCAQFLAGLLKTDPSRRFWGFKEIWNGSASFRIPWEAYDHVFPGATWVHLIRHPFDFLGSCVGWNGSDVSLGAFQKQLDDWAAIVRHSQSRASTGRYLEIRYEDLKKSPRTALESLFDRRGIEWSESCAETLKEKCLDSRRDTFAEQQLFRRLERTPQLMELAREYDYSL